MNEKVALREVTREEFVDLAQAGLRELFDLEPYKVVDGRKAEQQSYFVYEMKTHRCYLIDQNTCYQLVTAFYCGGEKPSILNDLNAIASSIE
ncbi:hypothetical protein JOC85_003747 [Bacillus mesophilus]|uniref:Uncharacterized protein n=1 Tax=Bacillus mesophilus TaxID=1808955 RepID=A0A6M0QB27_9BACI|nr:hypothetical protein [Bacillus mesophilus]MBM7662936.1 hypothetical protein [Bacillus mesophilus]NEY73525.1 hypothetical protein [Bacillus mesophilus]